MGTLPFPLSQSLALLVSVLCVPGREPGINISVPAWYAHQPDRSLSPHCSLVLSVKQCLMSFKEFNGILLEILQRQEGEKKSSLLYFPGPSQAHSRPETYSNRSLVHFCFVYWNYIYSTSVLKELSCPYLHLKKAPSSLSNTCKGSLDAKPCHV